MEDEVKEKWKGLMFKKMQMTGRLYMHLCFDFDI